VLVGGSTRIPLVRQLVKDLFQREPHTELNPTKSSRSAQPCRPTSSPVDLSPRRTCSCST
jgi:hypothetical protein